MNTLSVELIDETNNIYDLDGTIADGLQSAAQRVRQRLRFWRGTWYLDQNAGVPYLQDVLGQRNRLPLAASAITAQIRTVPDVTAVSDVNVIIRNRRLIYTATVHTIHGTLQIEETT